MKNLIKIKNRILLFIFSPFLYLGYIWFKESISEVCTFRREKMILQILQNMIFLHERSFMHKRGRKLD